MSAPNVFPLEQETLPRSLFGRPTRRAYRTAVAQIVRDVKAANGLSNESMGEKVGCHEDTIRNAENENGNLDAVTLLNIAYTFGEDAIAPVRQLYLCAAVEQPSLHDRLTKIEREAALIRRELDQ